MIHMNMLYVMIVTEIAFWFRSVPEFRNIVV